MRSDSKNRTLRAKNWWKLTPKNRHNFFPTSFLRENKAVLKTCPDSVFIRWTIFINHLIKTTAFKRLPCLNVWYCSKTSSFRNIIKLHIKCFQASGTLLDKLHFIVNPFGRTDLSVNVAIVICSQAERVGARQFQLLLKIL